MNRIVYIKESTARWAGAGQWSNSAICLLPAQTTRLKRFTRLKSSCYLHIDLEKKRTAKMIQPLLHFSKSPFHYNFEPKKNIAI